jgi:uncharacterized protein (TIGR03000 family)
MFNEFNRWSGLTFGGFMVGLWLQGLAEAQLLKRFSPKNDCATGSVASQSFGFPMDGAIQGGQYQIIEPNAAYLTINVPEVNLDTSDAELIINGDPTVSTGPSRRFIVRDMEPDKEYRFQIVAITANRANVERMEVKTIILRAGELQSVSLKPIRRRSIVQQELEQGALAGEGSSADFLETIAPDFVD